MAKATAKKEVIPADAPIDGKFQRTMLFFPPALLRNLDLCAMKEGRSKGEVVREAVTQYLAKHGYQPTRFPTKIDVAYSYD